MKLKKQLVSVGLCTAMVLQSGIPVFAQDLAEYEKKESVYAKLKADGTADNAYIINHFIVKKAGQITDYGTYETVENLTSLDDIRNQNGKTSFLAEEGDFYYQGLLQNAELPWDFHITYQLNGKTVSAEELGGKSGALKIILSMKEASLKENAFSDSYVTQISLTLDNQKAQNIKAEGAAIADAGADTQLSFTVLPGKEAQYTIEADVVNFSMSGFSAASVPYNMDIDTSDYDTGELTGQFDELLTATGELNDGMKKLSDGMKELDGNSQILLNGFSELKSGISKLDANSNTLLKGSAQIQNALSTISGSISLADFDGLKNLNELPASLNKLEDGLKNLRSGLSQLKTGFEQSYSALAQAMDTAQETTLSQEELASISSEISANTQTGSALSQAYSKLDAAVSSALEAMPSNSDIQAILDNINNIDPGLYGKLANLYVQAKNLQNTYFEAGPQIENAAETFSAESTSAQKLLAAYGSLQKILGTWEAVKPTFTSVTSSLDETADQSVLKGLDSVINGLEQMRQSLASSLDGADIESQMNSLRNGLSQLSSSYVSFHSGLSSYLGGVSSLFDGAAQYQNGLSEYLGGVGDSAKGSRTLKDGMEEYSEGVAKIPDTLQQKVDEMMAEYTSPDYQPVSFTDSRNEHIESVQFVISTEEITEPSKPDVQEEEKNTGFLERLKNLFQ